MDYAQFLRLVILDMGKHTPELRSIRVSRILLSSTPSRGEDKRGLWAYILPLRFENGKKVKFVRRGPTVQKYAIVLPYRAMRKIHRAPKEQFLYFLYVSAPRFYNLTLNEKLDTLLHEMYHIHPRFNGDLRKFPGSRYTMHGPSLKAYDCIIRELKKSYLKRTRAKRMLNILALNQAGLKKRFPDITFNRYQEPQETIVSVPRK